MYLESVIQHRCPLKAYNNAWSKMVKDTLLIKCKVTKDKKMELMKLLILTEQRVWRTEENNWASQRNAGSTNAHRKIIIIDTLGTYT